MKEFVQTAMESNGKQLDGDDLADMNLKKSRRERELTIEEKNYLMSVERGDIATVKKCLEDAFMYYNININCRDPFGRAALMISIENENTEMLELLLSFGVDTGDALLHAISEEYVEAVEILLLHETLPKKAVPEFMESAESSPTFTTDITPIILAAHRDNYEIIKILLDRGATIPRPHDVHCVCEACLQSHKNDSLMHSKSRINAYRALSSPCLICLSSKDPILTAFELSWELKRLSHIENEFKADYEKLAAKCKNFACDLLDQVRGSSELEVILNHDINSFENCKDQMNLSKLKLAIKYKQKKFVAHPHVQQLLASLWYEGLPGFRRRNVLSKLGMTAIIGLLFPILSIIYICAPTSRLGQLIRKPFIKFICQSASYFVFLFLLILVSQRIDIFSSDQDDAKIRKEMRGVGPSILEILITLWVFGLIWIEIKQIWNDGPREYVHDMWNLLDFITNTLYIAIITLRVVAYFRVEKERAEGNPAAELQRKDWDAYDPNLVAECMFAAANIFSQLKLVYIFTVNPHLGPLQISLGRMVVDIMKWAFVFGMVLFAFACGINQLYWYYAWQRQQECARELAEHGRLIARKHESCLPKSKNFANLFEISQSLYWALYGLTDLNSTGVKENHVFTEFIGKLMFGIYSAIMIIVLVNMLIAMMSNSYQIISTEGDTEWKFARSKLWISYFEDGGTAAAPFNIIMSPKTICYLLKWCKKNMCKCSTKIKRGKWETVKRIIRKVNEKEQRYQSIMCDLTKRYIMYRQKNEQNEGVTEDDINEIKQDVSSLRYELIAIFKDNQMSVPSYIEKYKSRGRTRKRRTSQKFQQLEKLNSFESLTHTSPSRTGIGLEFRSSL